MLAKRTVMKPEVITTVRMQSSILGLMYCYIFLDLMVSLKPFVFHKPSMNKDCCLPVKIPGTREAVKRNNHFHLGLSIDYGFQEE